MNPVTRFAPSPTGALHIGGARTALFNWLFARRHGGRFLLRLEDTDRARSSAAIADDILADLRWLGLDWDGEVVRQSERIARHQAAAAQLEAAGHAYRCWCAPEELQAMREAAIREKRPPRYDRRCRERTAPPPGRSESVLRFRVPLEGVCVFTDMIRGEMSIDPAQLDDLILLRADATPTYMLSVVVDDHDMGVTHIIRGEDHLTNAAKQLLLYQALGWEAPRFAHIPLIHSEGGAKLAKRAGALGIGAYKEQGYLAPALCNYLARLGWSHGDDEIFSMEQAIAWFSLDGVGKSPARFDAAKLAHLNGHYLRATDDAALRDMVLELAEGDASPQDRERLLALMPALKPRASTLREMAEASDFLRRSRPLALSEKASALLEADGARALLVRLRERLEGVAPWEAAALEAAVRGCAEAEGVKLGKVAQPLRAALTGETASPGIFDVLNALGREESLARLGDVAVSPE